MSMMKHRSTKESINRLRQLGLTSGGCLGQRQLDMITGLVLGDWGGGRSPTVAAAQRATSSPWSATYQQLYICERRRRPQAGEGGPAEALPSGQVRRRHSRAGAFDSSLCATMLERTGGVLLVTKRKWTDWGKVVRNKSGISLRWRLDGSWVRE